MCALILTSALTAVTSAAKASPGLAIETGMSLKSVVAKMRPKRKKKRPKVSDKLLKACNVSLRRRATNDKELSE